MIIKELILKNFGKFSNQSFALNEGINVLYGENEFGKSTVHTFIKGMLFGMERGRGRAAKNDTFSIYEPWENSNYYSGMLRFQCDERSFILNRTFDKQSKKVTLVCEDDGEVLSVPQGDLDMLLGKLDGVNYENTVSIAQRRAETTEELSAELKNFAANYHSKGDSDIQVESVQAYLKNKKKDIENRIKDQKSHLDNQREKLILERDYIQREIERLSSMLKENQKLENLNKVKQEKEGEKFKIPYIPCLCILVFILAILSIVPPPWNVLSVIVIILAICLYVWNKMKHRVLGREKKKEMTKEFDKVRWEKKRLLSELQEKEVVLDNVEEQIQELLEMRISELEEIEQVTAIELAMERVEIVSRNIQRNFGMELNEGASEIFRAITGERDSRVVVDDVLRVSLYRTGRNLSLEQVSRGTVEQVYFALRMAITELLHTEELPILLDDTFAYYDEVRLKQVLAWLGKNKKQVIIFSCHKREMELLEELQIRYHKVNPSVI